MKLLDGEWDWIMGIGSTTSVYKVMGCWNDRMGSYSYEGDI